GREASCRSRPCPATRAGPLRVECSGIAVGAGVGGVTVVAMPATSTRRKGAARAKPRKGSGRGRARASRGRRTRSGAGNRSEPTALRRTREAAGAQLAGHRADAVAVGLLVLGSLAALGVWTDLAGPVGHGLAEALGAGFGRARVALPVVCVAFALLILWPRRPAPVGAAADEPRARSPGPPT